MLLSLHIENVAVIKCVDIDFEKGFTALTGETGAGKSILIDSIGFLLGARGRQPAAHPHARCRRAHAV